MHSCWSTCQKVKFDETIKKEVTGKDYRKRPDTTTKKQQRKQGQKGRHRNRLRERDTDKRDRGRDRDNHRAGREHNRTIAM